MKIKTTIPHFIIIAVIPVYWILFGFLRDWHYDSPSYIGGARYIFGLPGGFDQQSRLTKPLPLIMPGLLEKYLGINPTYIFIGTNLILFWLTSWLVFRFLRLITGEYKLAMAGLIIFLTCQCMAIYPFAVLTDIWGWFFGIAGIISSIAWFGLARTDEDDYFGGEPWHSRSLIWSIDLGLILGLGLLAKESAVSGAIFFCCLLATHWRLWKRGLLVLGIAGLIFASGLLFTRMVFGDDITRRIQEVQQYVGGSIFYNRANIGELWHILDACWLLVPLGFIAIYRRERSDDYKLWLAMGATAVFAIVILPLVYPFIVDRLLFMAVPLLLPFAVMGLGMISWKYAYALAAAGGLISLSTTWMIYHYNKSGLLAIGAAAYMLILGFTLLLSKEEQEKG